MGCMVSTVCRKLSSSEMKSLCVFRHIIRHPWFSDFWLDVCVCARMCIQERCNISKLKCETLVGHL